MTRARSLSLLANENVFTVDGGNNRIGIGSATPDAKLDIQGNIEVAGIITAAAGFAVTYFGDGSGLTGVASTDNIVTGTPATFNNQVTIQNLYVGAATTIQGTLSYEDVTNVDSLGIITARSHVSIADSILHTGDTDTSIRFPAAGTFTVETNGSERFRITDSLKEVKNGNLRITSTFIEFSGDVSTPSAAAALYRPADNEFAISTGNVERLRITSTGNVGIGTTNPRTKLEIAGNTTNVNGYSDGQVQIVGNNPIAFVSQSNLSPSVNRWGFQVRAAGGDGKFSIYDFTNSRHSLLIDSSGNVGIGTEIPGTKLHVIGSIQAEDYSASGNAWTYHKNSDRTWLNGIRGTNSDVYSIYDLTTDAERFNINSSGAFGLNGNNYGTAGQVLTSNGSGSAVSWEDASGGGITTEAATPSNAITQINLTDATDHKITATGICTITSTTAGTEGQSHTIRIVNSGIATVGFSTYFLFPSGSVPSLPTADGAVSIISFTVHDSVGAGCTQLLAGASLNFS